MKRSVVDQERLGCFILIGVAIAVLGLCLGVWSSLDEYYGGHLIIVIGAAIVAAPILLVAIWYGLLMRLQGAQSRRARERAGLSCGSCGYDLRGSASESCPECGAKRE